MKETKQYKSLEELLAFLEYQMLMVENRMRVRVQGPSRDQSETLTLTDRCYQMGLANAAGKITGESKESVVSRIQNQANGTTKKRVVKRAVKKKVVVRKKK